jgi:glycosyltransferase involved in cell wall biosynthesis
MGERLREAYGVREVRSLSNAAFVPPAREAPAVRRRLACIGLLGNLCAAKGVFDFLDTVELLVSRGVPVRARLAGPFDGEATRSQVLARAAKLPVEYVGPRYGEDKARFYEGIDALLFPTRYVNEAEPLTILEALMHGVPVISFARGCISELLEGGAGRRVAPDEDFAHAAAARLERWYRRPEVLAAASGAAARRFAELRTAALEARAALLHEICPAP